MTQEEVKTQQFTLFDVPEYPATSKVDFNIAKEAADKAKSSKNKKEAELGEQCLKLIEEVRQLRLYIGGLHMNLKSLNEFKAHQDIAIAELWNELGKMVK
jgi:hypothetical protein